MALRVSDVIGRDRLSALRAEGKDNAAILKEVNTVLDPIKKIIGEDVYNSFSTQGISFSKMKEYADYQAQKAVDAANKAEEKAYQSEVKARKDEFMQPDVSYVDALEGTTKPVGKDPEFIKKTAKDGATFSDALVNNEARLASFINPANPFTGDKVDPYWAGVIQAMPELEKKYKEGRLTPETLAQYTQDQKNIENAKGVWDTLGEVGKDMYHRLQNPDAINVPAALGDMVSPENFIGGPAGGALAKVGTKVGAKLLSGAVVGAAADTAANYGYEFGVEKGQGASNEDARKGAAVQALVGALPGAVLGAGGAGLRMKRKLREGDTSVSPDADLNNPNQPKIIFDMGTDTTTPKDTFNPMSADEVVKKIDKVVIPKDVADSPLLKIEKGADDTVARAEKIAEISKTVTDPIEKAKAIAKEAPASAEEHTISYVLNDGMPVSDRLAGYANVDALEKSILSNKQTPQEIYYTLSKEGFQGENLNKMVESYIKKDVNIYDDWAAAKLRESTKGETNAKNNTGNERQDTGVETARTDTVDAGDGKTVDANTEPQALPEPKPRDTENIGDIGRDTGNLDTKDGLPQKSKGVDGHATVTDDGGTVPRDRENTVVQDENGVGADEGVETPTQVYARLKDEPALSDAEKTRLKSESDVYEASLVKDTAPVDVKKTNTNINDVANVKKLSDLTSHRYFDDMVEMVKAEKAKEFHRVKRMTPSDKRIELEKLGWDKSDDRYNAEMQKFFKKDREQVQSNFHSYTKAELRQVEDGKITPPLATKLKVDLAEYAANPLYEKDRAEIDGGYRAFSDEASILKEMSHDEALGLVESETFRDGYDSPMSVEDMVKVVDDVLLNAAKKVEESKMGKDIDALFGKETHIKLSQAQGKVVQLVKDPMKRTMKRRTLEHKELKNRLKRAKIGKNKGAITKATNNLKKFEDEFMSDGKIKKMGEC